MRDLAAAAATVTEALAALLEHVKDGSQLMKRNQVEESFEALLASAKAVQEYVIRVHCSVVLVRPLHFSYGLVTVCKVHLHNGYCFG